MANIAQIMRADVANGPGIRLSTFLSGCRIHCKNCFQPQVWDFNYGTPATDRLIESIVTEACQPHYRGITVLGGEPFEPENQPLLLDIVSRMRETNPNKDIWVYTGNTLEMLRTNGDQHRTALTDIILASIDVLVDGPFQEENHQLGLRFRGSTNQRLIDMPATLASGSIALWGDGDE